MLGKADSTQAILIAVIILMGHLAVHIGAQEISEYGHEVNEEADNSNDDNVGPDDHNEQDSIKDHPPGTYKTLHYDTGYVNRWWANISVRVYYPASNSENKDMPLEFPLVLFCEGYIGFGDRIGMDKSFYYWIAENISTMGYIVVIFDFQGQGDSDIGNKLPEKYNKHNIELWPDMWPWVDDINDTLTWALAQNSNNLTSPVFNKIDSQNIGLMGHSTGAAQGLVASMLDPRFGCFAGMATYDNNSHYKPPYPTDFLGKRNIPILLMAGTNDAIVPPMLNSKAIYSAAPTPKEYVLIENAAHNPWEWKDDLALVYAERWFNLLCKGEEEYFDDLKSPANSRVTVMQNLGKKFLADLTMDVQIPLNFGYTDENLTLEITIVNNGFAIASHAVVDMVVDKVLYGDDRASAFNHSETVFNIPGLAYTSKNHFIMNINESVIFEGRFLFRLSLLRENDAIIKEEFFYYSVEVRKAPEKEEEDNRFLIIIIINSAIVIIVIVIVIIFSRRRNDP